MQDDYKSIKEALDKLRETVEELTGKKKLQYNKTISERCDGLKNDGQAVKDAFPQEVDWPNAPNKAETIRMVKEELPFRAKMLDESMRQAAEGLVVARKEACGVVVVGTLLLIVFAAIYVSIHACAKDPKYDKKIAGEFFNSIGKVKGVLLKPDVTFIDVRNAINALPSASPVKEGTTVTAKEDLLTAQFRERISYLKGFAETFENSEGRSADAQDKTGKQPPFTSSDQRIALLKEEIDKIEKDARILSAKDEFFWFWGFWRWLEILFWGEFGVITSILVWVSTQTECGKYTMASYNREKYWYITEVIVGPFVIIAAFFLLKQFIATILGGITEEDVSGSIYLTLGISFVLGLFIRRTFGIFDAIKDNLPLPKS
ncbi:MAG: hypothetical protein WC856_25350 [Methylococcaceae bacterium]|jgi:hypothetical protein